MDFLLDFILHIDQYMVMIVRDYHAWTYAILFSIIFCETGLVVTPFLPGDSLLFVAGAISALPDMPISVHILVIILFAAAVLGDSCNYISSAESCLITPTPGYSNKVIWRKHTSSIKSMVGKQLF